MVLRVYFLIEEIIHLIAMPFLILLSIFKPLRKEIMPRLFPHSFDGRRVILHGASIGEIKSLLPIGKELERFGIPLLFTSATINGVKTALNEGFSGQLFPLEFSISHFFFFKNLTPIALIIAERDYWFRFIKGVRKRGGKIVVVNFSYPKKSLFKRHFIKLLKDVRPLFFARDESERDFLVENGFERERIKILPSLKSLSVFHSEEKKEGNIFLAISTHEEEHPIIKSAFEKLREKYEIKLVLAPRYMKKIKELKNSFSGFDICFYSEGKEKFDVLIVDRYGVLNSFYPSAKVAFVGGSIARKGCHDLLEACSWKLPILFGPNFWNQKEIAEILIKKNGGAIVKNSEEIFNAISSIINEDETAPSGERAFQVYENIRVRSQEGLKEILMSML